jgi:hypothetical protein
VAEHENVRTGAENPLLQAGDDHGVDFGMLEAQPLNGVGELEVDAEVVRVQLELIVGREARILAHVHRERCDRPVEGKLPVLVPIRVCLDLDGTCGRDFHKHEYAPVEPGRPARGLHDFERTFKFQCSGTPAPRSRHVTAWLALVSGCG